MWLAWHIDGMSWDRWLDLSRLERIAISDALDEQIEQHNEAAKPKGDAKGF